jgi:thioredoxin 1
MASLHLTDATFKASVLESTKPVLIDFEATWCGPCRAIAPVIEELASEYAGKAVIAKADMDECPDISSSYGVRSVPMFLIFKNGELVDQIVGVAGKEKLKARLHSHM